MVKATECLKREHADLEKLLDELAAAIRSSGNWAESLRRAAEVCAEHYRKERQFLERFGAYEPLLAARIEAQHAEACELAQRFEEAVDEGHDADALSLARRFHAIAQHVKLACPASHAFLMGYTNGYIGYFPEQKAFAEGGYEPAVSDLDPAAEGIYTHQIVEVLKRFR